MNPINKTIKHSINPSKKIKVKNPIKPIKVTTQTIDVRIDLTKTYMKSNYLFPEDDEWNGTVDIKTIII